MYRGAGLSLQWLQERLGDGVFANMLSGSAPALACAIKSLPTYDDIRPDDKEILSGEAKFVEALSEKLKQVEQEFETSIEEDERLLECSGIRMGWQREAIVYRLGRKKMAKAARLVLDAYRE
jgi:hypothetical protein